MAKDQQSITTRTFGTVTHMPSELLAKGGEGYPPPKKTQPHTRKWLYQDVGLKSGLMLPVAEVALRL